MDTWHHLRGLSEVFSPRNLEKCNFARAPTISHDCAKWKIHQHYFRLPGAFRVTVRNFHIVMRSFWAVTKFPYGPFRTTVRIFRMFMRNEKNIVFQLFLPFIPFLSLDFTSTTSKLTPNTDPNRWHCLFHYAFRLSSTLFVLFNLIHLFCHQFIKIIPWNDSKTS